VLQIERRGHSNILRSRCANADLLRSARKENTRTLDVRLSELELLREPERERDWIVIRGLDRRVNLPQYRLDGPRYKRPIN
jgi:hypothetical protein